MDGKFPKVVELVQYGMGGVGRALFGLVVQNGSVLKEKTGVEIRYRALVDSTHVLHIDQDSSADDSYLKFLWNQLEPESHKRLSSQAGAKPSTGPLAIAEREIERHRQENTGSRLVFLDVSGADAAIMTPMLQAVLQAGHSAVLANKKPLCGPIADFKALLEAAGPGANRLRYETTVGAALPVISTVKMLQDSFDEILNISGCFSGTLGFLTAELETGRKYSDIVTEAKNLGYTEPDPRDDLGGVDVARKALILARTTGLTAELADIKVEALYPAELAGISVKDFLARLPELDEQYMERSKEAAAQGNTLRYVATVVNGNLKVGLDSVAKDSQIGQLRGADNIVVIKTGRYQPQPLVIQGRGAGPELTASGVLADIVSLGKAAG